jgi:hypothetical protein
MTKIEKLKAVLKNEEIKNDRIFDNVLFCQKHKFEIEAQVIKKVYDAKRELLQTIRLTVIDELIDP